MKTDTCNCTWKVGCNFVRRNNKKCQVMLQCQFFTKPFSGPIDSLLDLNVVVQLRLMFQFSRLNPLYFNYDKRTWIQSLCLVLLSFWFQEHTVVILSKKLFSRPERPFFAVSDSCAFWFWRAESHYSSLRCLIFVQNFIHGTLFQIFFTSYSKCARMGFFDMGGHFFECQVLQLFVLEHGPLRGPILCIQLFVLCQAILSFVKKQFSQGEIVLGVPGTGKVRVALSPFLK